LFKDLERFHFQPYIFADVAEGQYLTLEARDTNANDDLDIKIGSYVFGTNAGIKNMVPRKWIQLLLACLLKARDFNLYFSKQS
jgi:capsid portal protein